MKLCITGNRSYHIAENKLCLDNCRCPFFSLHRGPASGYLPGQHSQEMGKLWACTFGNLLYVYLVIRWSLAAEKKGICNCPASLFSAMVINRCRIQSFISRLNLMPFVGGKRYCSNRCHFDPPGRCACATGIYLNSTLDFYSSKPFMQQQDRRSTPELRYTSFTRGDQYFTKGGGQVAVVDTRIKSEI